MSHRDDKVIRQTGSYELFCNGESVKKIVFTAGTRVHKAGKSVLIFYDPEKLKTILRFNGINPAFAPAEE